MSGPRRHRRRLPAAACFVLLVLAFVLVRGSAASAHGSAQHQRAKHAPGLLGGLGAVVSQLGGTVDTLLNGVGSALGNTPRTHTPTPPSTTPPRTSPSHPRTPGAPAGSSTRHAPTPAPAHGSPTNLAVHVAYHAPRHVARPASPVVASSSADPAQAQPHGSSTSPAAALDPRPTELPVFGITAALAAVTIAMVLGIGLIVYRAGYRAERTH